MSDGTSSEASYSYESESQHWEFGDYDYLDDADDQVEVEDAQFEDNRQPLALGMTRSSSQDAREDQQLVTDQDRDGEGGPRLQDSNEDGGTEGGQRRDQLRNTGVRRWEMMTLKTTRVTKWILGRNKLVGTMALTLTTTAIMFDAIQLSSILTGISTPERVSHVATVIAPAAAAAAVDVSTRMEAETDRLATTNQGMTAQQIWESVSQRFYRRDDGMVIRGLTHTAPSDGARTDLTFFQFQHIYHEAGHLQSIIGWAHPRLLELLRYPGIQLFIDGTFRSVPRSFHQCVVVMVQDAASRVFIPVVYVLTTNRAIPTYNRLFRELSDGARIGCLFHWKQAIRRRMIALHLPAREIGIAMEVGVLDMLTVVPPADRYVRLLNDITNRRAGSPQQGVVQLPVPVPLTRQGAQRRQARRGRRQTRQARWNNKTYA
ncbi:hypothetical protein PHYSODRAFT_338030 [Phytophthora sojae]|uniref:MULE transposase domain-containing protein n=1 Tax=Phytophthora sojae (strain P6497) TaxID=1094619 RepID=G5A067_PHYSP|nr:hypothetical protein PHYSODRAFT_338030 [Phytophthora sojae]EGZ11310.1 hypothetical protein PHYSODRAFT_338030 [Phytophthora sojae]|eukprot:XP_009534055.1 hypothetical protein PHYSODRAFT_338030 [Phytophthora sojae]